jgi:hypothetical protein
MSRPRRGSGRDEVTLLAHGHETLLAHGHETLLAHGHETLLAYGRETLLAHGHETLLAHGDGNDIIGDAPGNMNLVDAFQPTLMIGGLDASFDGARTFRGERNRSRGRGPGGTLSSRNAAASRETTHHGGDVRQNRLYSECAHCRRGYAPPPGRVSGCFRHRLNHSWIAPAVFRNAPGTHDGQTGTVRLRRRRFVSKGLVLNR